MRDGGFGVEGVREVLEMVAIAIVGDQLNSSEWGYSSYQYCWMRLGNEDEKDKFSIRCREVGDV